MYLIDGNNVMGQRVGWHRNKPAAQQRLLAELQDLYRRGQETVTVVFDGRPQGGIDDGASVDGVLVYFARIGCNADDRMVELAGDLIRSEEIIAVTSDRHLIERLRQLGARTMRSGEFRRLLQEPPGL